jgi:hypothetical protein
MAPRHPISYLAKMEIRTRIMGMPNMSNIPVVTTTGPEALKAAFTRFLGQLNSGPIGEGVLKGVVGNNWTVRKVAREKVDEYIAGNLNGTLRMMDRHEA